MLALRLEVKEIYVFIAQVVAKQVCKSFQV